jgi:hypothetical protein
MNAVQQKRILKILLRGLSDLSKPDLIRLKVVIQNGMVVHRKILSVRRVFLLEDTSNDMLNLAEAAFKQSLIAIDKEIKSRNKVVS